MHLSQVSLVGEERGFVPHALVDRGDDGIDSSVSTELSGISPPLNLSSSLTLVPLGTVEVRPLPRFYKLTLVIQCSGSSFQSVTAGRPIVWTSSTSRWATRRAVSRSL